MFCIMMIPMITAAQHRQRSVSEPFSRNKQSIWLSEIFQLNGEYVSKLNPFSTIWCVIENIFLAAAAEGLGCSMRIPLNEEHDIVKAKLKVPPTYMIPVFIGVGYADPNETVLEQNVANLDKQIHFGRWKWDASERNACKKRNNQVQPACLWLLRQPICRLHPCL